MSERLTRENNVPIPKDIMIKKPWVIETAIVVKIRAVYKRAQGIKDQRIPKKKGLMLLSLNEDRNWFIFLVTAFRKGGCLR